MSPPAEMASVRASIGSSPEAQEAERRKCHGVYHETRRPNRLRRSGRVDSLKALGIVGDEPGLPEQPEAIDPSEPLRDRANRQSLGGQSESVAQRDSQQDAAKSIFGSLDSKTHGSSGRLCLRRSSAIASRAGFTLPTATSASPCRIASIVFSRSSSEEFYRIPPSGAIRCDRSLPALPACVNPNSLFAATNHLQQPAQVAMR